MANYKTNEEVLLTYLKELKEQTLSSVRMEEKTLNFWVSGEYKEYVDSGDITKPTNHQIDFYITNCENRLNPLRFRLMWLESQIKEITNKFNTPIDWKDLPDWEDVNLPYNLDISK